MSDSEKELFGDPAESPDVSDNDIIEDDGEPEREPVRKSVSIKRYAPSHASTKSWVSRVPAFLNLDPQPFDADKFDESGKSAEELAAETNTVRWTYAANDSTEEGAEKVKRVSNARVVTWSDGSQTLMLGNEHFEIKSHPQTEPAFITSSQEDQNVLATRQLVDNSMTFLPTSTSSATHAMLARSLARKQESNQIRVGSVDTTEDPDKMQREIERTEQAKEKARRKLSAQREDIVSYTDRSTYGPAVPASDDESMDEGASEASDNDEDDRHASRLNKIKHRKDGEDEDDDEDEEEVGDEDEKAIDNANGDDEDSKTSRVDVQRRKVLDDDDDDSE